MRLRARALLTAVCTVLLLLGSVGAAQTSAARPAAAAGEADCAAVLAPVAPGATTSKVLAYECFDTAADSLAFASTGDPMTALAGPLLGVEYTGTSWTGSSLALYGSYGTGCTSAWYGYPTMPGGWNNNISSARSYSGCTSRHFDGTNYTGSSYLCGCGSMGSMNNRTSSISFD